MREAIQRAIHVTRQPIHPICPEMKTHYTFPIAHPAHPSPHRPLQP